MSANTKQKMIEAGCKAFLAAYGDPAAEPMDYRREVSAMLDAALAVMEDPENWTDDMNRVCYPFVATTKPEIVRAVIDHIRNQEPKP